MLVKKFAIGILLSNPNRYLGIVTTAPVSITNGIPSFAFNAFQVLFDTGKIINRRGSTFNRDTHTAANKTIKRLQLQGFIDKQPYRSIFLTEKGQKIALSSKKRHEIVYKFLINLGVSKKIALADSEGIEHHVSKKTLDKMEKFNEKF